MQQNEAEKARVTMERALQANKSKDHISIVQKFARLEFELGDVEKGKTIFEQTIKVKFIDWKLDQSYHCTIQINSCFSYIRNEGTYGQCMQIC